MEWFLLLDNLNALNEWDVDIVDVVLVNLVQKYQDPTQAPGLKRTKNGHVWINHTYLLEQVPFLKIGTQALKKRFRYLVDVGILEREIIYPQTDNGVRKNTCYRISAVFAEMCHHYMKIQGVHSNKGLNAQEKQHELSFLEKDKPKTSRRVIRYPTGARLERDEKGCYRRVTEYPTQGYLNTLDPSSRDSISKKKESAPPPDAATRPPGPGKAGAPDPAAGGEEGKSNEEQEELRRKIAEIPDQVERCRKKAYYRSLGYDV